MNMLNVERKHIDGIVDPSDRDNPIAFAAADHFAERGDIANPETIVWAAYVDADSVLLAGDAPDGSPYKDRLGVDAADFLSAFYAGEKVEPASFAFARRD